MDEQNLKHVITLSLEDARHLQQIGPNAGAETRILLVGQALKTCGTQAPSRTEFMNFMANTLTPLPCNGEKVNHVYHDTMARVLRVELDGLRRKIVMNETVTN